MEMKKGVELAHHVAVRVSEGSEALVEARIVRTLMKVAATAPMAGLLGDTGRKLICSS